MTLTTISYEQIRYEVSDPVATITLDRPEALNAWTPRMAAEVRHAVHRAAADPAVVGIVLTGAGRAFCAGADMNVLAAIGQATASSPDDGSTQPGSTAGAPTGSAGSSGTQPGSSGSNAQTSSSADTGRAGGDAHAGSGGSGGAQTGISDRSTQAGSSDTHPGGGSSAEAGSGSGGGGGPHASGGAETGGGSGGRQAGEGGRNASGPPRGADIEVVVGGGGGSAQAGRATTDDDGGGGGGGAIGGGQLAGVPAELAVPPDPDRPPDLDGEYTYLLACPKPIVAAINGPIAGMAVPIALCCDIRFMAEDAPLVTAFAERGLVAEWGLSWLLPRLVGPAVALDLLFSSRRVTGAEAAQMGLVNAALPAGEVLSHSVAYVESLARRCSPTSLSIMKRQVYAQLHAGLGPAEQEAQRLMLASFGRPDFAEGVAAFLQKRPPSFGRLGETVLPDRT